MSGWCEACSLPHACDGQPPTHRGRLCMWLGTHEASVSRPLCVHIPQYFIHVSQYNTCVPVVLASVVLQFVVHTPLCEVATQ